MGSNKRIKRLEKKLKAHIEEEHKKVIFSKHNIHTAVTVALILYMIVKGTLDPTNLEEILRILTGIL
jgi:hypothetical protein